MKDCVQLLHLWLAKRELESRRVKDRDFKGVDIRELDLLPSFYRWWSVKTDGYCSWFMYNQMKYNRIQPIMGTAVCRASHHAMSQSQFASVIYKPSKAYEHLLDHYRLLITQISIIGRTNFYKQFWQHRARGALILEKKRKKAKANEIEIWRHCMRKKEV